MAKILFGDVVRDKIAKDLKKEISRLRSKPKLVIIQVDDVAESTVYIGRKVKFGQSIGALVDHVKLPKNIPQKELISQLSILNSDKSVHGIITQLPIPDSLDKDAVIETIDPKKDVDGLTSTNLKLLFEGKQNGLTPATTKGILTLLNFYKIPVAGKKVTIVGRSSLVGKPTAIYLLNHDATVSICHTKTKDLALETKTADILISAVGQPGLITKDHVRKDQVIIDVGTTVVNGKLTGDVKFKEVSEIVAAITPVPKGIGPMTVVSLFENLLQAYDSQT